MTVKPCTKCNTSERYKSGNCRKCHSEYNKQYRLSNKDRMLKLTNDWRKNNKFKISQYLEKNRDKRLAVNRLYDKQRNKKIDPIYNRIQSHERRLIEKRAKPEWNNQFFMEEAFDLAILREKCLGIKYHVDHVIPLKNKVVSGLHAHTNIAVIPAILNIRKQTRLIEVKPY